MERSNKTRLFIILGAVAIIAIIVVVVVLNWPKDFGNVTIMNQSAISDVKNDQQYDFKKKLYNLLLDQKLIEEDAKIEDVVIREDSVVTYTRYDEEKKRTTTTTFLIDIDSVEQTYEVKIVDADEELTDLAVQITCPHISKSKYPDSVCEGVYGDTSRKVEKHIPYEMKLDTGEKIIVKNLEATMGGSKLLHIYLYSCDEKNPRITETKDAVHDWVKSLGDESSEFYTYNVRTGYCEGDTI